MGARWAWTAVCSGPEHHVYSNFSGGADDCYECGAEPEIEFGEDDGDSAQDYAKRRRAGAAPEAIAAEDEMVAFQSYWENSPVVFEDTHYDTARKAWFAARGISLDA